MSKKICNQFEDGKNIRQPQIILNSKFPITPNNMKTILDDFLRRRAKTFDDLSKWEFRPGTTRGEGQWWLERFNSLEGTFLGEVLIIPSNESLSRIIITYPDNEAIIIPRFSSPEAQRLGVVDEEKFIREQKELIILNQSINDEAFEILQSLSNEITTIFSTIDSGSFTQRKDVLKYQRSDPGRPRYASDVWAWVEMNYFERKKNEVYSIWVKIMLSEVKDGIRDLSESNFVRTFNSITDNNWLKTGEVKLKKTD